MSEAGWVVRVMLWFINFSKCEFSLFEYNIKNPILNTIGFLFMNLKLLENLSALGLY